MGLCLSDAENLRQPGCLMNESHPLPSLSTPPTQCMSFSPKGDTSSACFWVSLHSLCTRVRAAKAPLRVLCNWDYDPRWIRLSVSPCSGVVSPVHSLKIISADFSWFWRHKAHWGDAYRCFWTTCRLSSLFPFAAHTSLGCIWLIHRH